MHTDTALKRRTKLVVSGDTTYSESPIAEAKGCDILVHEVYSRKGWEARTPGWQRYHAVSHTSRINVGRIAAQVNPKKLVRYHPLPWDRRPPSAERGHATFSRRSNLWQRSRCYSRTRYTDPMRQFFSELERLQAEIVQMADLVKSNIHRSILCLVERNPDYADQVFRDESLVNQSEIAIDDFATRLVTLNQPVASDMRLIIAALKINTDLERMGDLAVNIARRAVSLIEHPPLVVPIPAMAGLVEDMVSRCSNAFATRDEALARSVLVADDQVDRSRNDIYDLLTAVMEQDPKMVRTGLRYMFIARNLERIADHATNVAEDVIFWVKGIDVRHQNEGRPPVL